MAFVGFKHGVCRFLNSKSMAFVGLSMAFVGF